VEQVEDQKALLEPFFNALNKLQRYAWGLAVAEVIAAVLLVSNTIRVSAYGRRRETGIMRLVGASNFSIQVPFLVEGVLAGFMGALLASGGLVALKALVIDGDLRDTFQFTAFVGWDDVLSVVPWLFVTGILLAGLASFVTLRRFLRV
jgi:cell division transport system permease protein